MNIIADENLAFTDYFFSSFGNIIHKAGRTLKSEDLQQTDALLVRSVTQVNADLLAHSSVKFVGSATIGTDHLDIPFLESQHIQWANAAGCNAQAVAEYVVTALLTLRPELIDAQHDFCLGIVGLGNVGTRLAQLANTLGWRVIGCDPFKSHTHLHQTDLTDLLQQADAVSLHVPITTCGEYPTHHLMNTTTLKYLKPNCILINSARGPVIEENALIEDIQKTQRKVVLDVFEHEPVISEKLLNLLAIATPHIAGYSLEGKARGTQMIYQAFCNQFEFSANKTFESQLDTCPTVFKDQDFKTVLMSNIKNFYDIYEDDRHVRACLKDGLVDQKSFDLLRKNYRLRREWSAYGASI